LETLRVKDSGRPAVSPERDTAAEEGRATLARMLREPTIADTDCSGTIDSKESVAVGVALGLDAFAAGFGASLSGFSLAIVPLVAVACPLFLILGFRLVSRFGPIKVLEKGGAIPGLALVVIGLAKMLASDTALYPPGYGPTLVDHPIWMV